MDIDDWWREIDEPVRQKGRNPQKDNVIDHITLLFRYLERDEEPVDRRKY